MATTVLQRVRVTEQLKVRPDRAKVNGSSLMTLANEVLLMIVDSLHLYTEESHTLDERGRHMNDLVSLSSACKRLRVLSLPLILKEVKLGAEWSPKWIRESMYALEKSDAKFYANHLNVHLWAPAGATTKEQQITTGIWHFIDNLPLLEKLTLTVSSKGSSALIQGIPSSQRLVSDTCGFDKITELVLSPQVAWFLKICPNVASVTIRDSVACDDSSKWIKDSIVQCGKKSNLRHFKLESIWQPELIWMISDELYHLESLTLPSGANLWDILPAIKNMNLRKLTLPESESLVKLGSQQTIPLSEAMREEMTAARIERDDDWLSWYDEIAMRALFSELSDLQELSLGRQFSARRKPSSPTDPMDKHFFNAEYVTDTRTITLLCEPRRDIKRVSYRTR